MLVATRLGYVAPKKTWWNMKFQMTNWQLCSSKSWRWTRQNLGFHVLTEDGAEFRNPSFKPIDLGSLCPVEAGWSSRLPIFWDFYQGKWDDWSKDMGVPSRKHRNFGNKKMGFDHRWDVREDQYGNIEEEHQLPSNFEMEASERSGLKSYPLVNVYCT